MTVWGIVVAGGSGRRFGSLKQLEPLAGRRVIDIAVDALDAHVDGVVVVVPGDTLDRVEWPGDVVVAGGGTRSESVRSGLAVVPAAADRVLVHDGARPLVAADVVTAVIAGLEEASAVVPVVAVTDSLRTVDGRSVDRSGFVAVQTPQGFRRDSLERAHASAGDATDDATLVDELGEVVMHVDGDPNNIKITEPEDLAVAEVLLGARGGNR